MEGAMKGEMCFFFPQCEKKKNHTICLTKISDVSIFQLRIKNVTHVVHVKADPEIHTLS